MVYTWNLRNTVLCCCSVTIILYYAAVQSPSHLWLCDPVDCSTPGLPVPHSLSWSLPKEYCTIPQFKKKKKVIWWREVGQEGLPEGWARHFVTMAGVPGFSPGKSGLVGCACILDLARNVPRQRAEVCDPWRQFSSVLFADETCQLKITVTSYK